MGICREDEKFMRVFMSNLRIKNKRLKRELELLKKQTVQPKMIYDRREVFKLRYTHAYTFDEFSNLPSSVVMNEICRSLVDLVRPNISITTYNELETGRVIVKGELSVLSKEE